MVPEASSRVASGRSPRLRVVVAILCLLWVAVPTGTYVLLTGAERSVVVEATVEVWAPVRANVEPIRRSVDVVLTWSSA